MNLYKFKFSGFILLVPMDPSGVLRWGEKWASFLRSHLKQIFNKVSGVLLAWEKSIRKNVQSCPNKSCLSEVVSTHLWNAPLNLYQKAIIRDSFHNWLRGLPGPGVRGLGVCCNFLGHNQQMCQGLNSHCFHIIGDKLINPIP